MPRVHHSLALLAIIDLETADNFKNSHQFLIQTIVFHDLFLQFLQLYNISILL